MLSAEPDELKVEEDATELEEATAPGRQEVSLLAPTVICKSR